MLLLALQARLHHMDVGTPRGDDYLMRENADQVWANAATDLQQLAGDSVAFRRAVLEMIQGAVTKFPQSRPGWREA